MKDLIMKALHKTKEITDNNTPVRENKTINVNINGIKIGNLPKFMDENNIPDYAVVTTGDSNSDIVLSYNAIVNKTAEDILEDKRKIFTLTAYKEVYNILIENEYIKIENPSRNLYAPYLYDYYCKADFDWLINHYSSFFVKRYQKKRKIPFTISLEVNTNMPVSNIKSILQDRIYKILDDKNQPVHLVSDVKIYFCKEGRIREEIFDIKRDSLTEDDTSNMKIFYIKHEEIGFDVFMSHVVVAYNEEDVVTMVKQIAANETEEVWLDNSSVLIIGDYIGEETEPFILSSVYNRS